MNMEVKREYDREYERIKVPAMFKVAFRQFIGQSLVGFPSNTHPEHQ
jgi:hypothetical protein